MNTSVLTTHFLKENIIITLKSLLGAPPIPNIPSLSKLVNLFKFCFHHFLA